MKHESHDPLARQEENEPRFTLLSRDPTAADLVRLWYAMRKRDPSLCDVIFKRMMGTMKSLPYQPHKDREHIVSAMQVANAMDVWLISRQQNPAIDVPEPDEAAPLPMVPRFVAAAPPEKWPRVKVIAHASYSSESTERATVAFSQEEGTEPVTMVFAGTGALAQAIVYARGTYGVFWDEIVTNDPPMYPSS